MPSVWLAAAIALAFQASVALRAGVPQDDSDLFNYVSRPDLKPARFDIKVSDPAKVSPGYWFVAPYVDLRSRAPTSLYSAGQTGPHIYDGNGELVWSGAALYDGRTSFDFKATTVNGTDCFSMIVNEDLLSSYEAAGAGVILDSSYQVINAQRNTVGRGVMNMHEYNVVDDGKSALMITFDSKLVSLSVDESGREVNGWMGNNGFQEIDLQTGESRFVWWALDHIHPFESLVKRPHFPGSFSSAWDFFHMNSVDKTADGDYLISARYTNTIYKISKTDGSIIWRLGGMNSSFELDGFDFSSQHDARVVEEHGTVTVVSFLNNAADDATTTSDHSSGLLVSCDTSNGKATLLKRWDRPDSSLTRLRGNVQTLPDNHRFISWSENAYISEYDAEGRLVLDAQFASHRFVTYRAYKFDFVGKPVEPPMMKAYVYGTTPETSTTVLYVSWNGATEVAKWNFYAGKSSSGVFTRVGSADKTGFETMFMVSGYDEFAYAEAVSADGSILGRSDAEKVIAPTIWSGEKHATIGVRPSSQKPEVQNDIEIPAKSNSPKENTGVAIEGSSSFQEIAITLKENIKYAFGGGALILVLLLVASYFIISSCKRRRRKLQTLPLSKYGEYEDEI